MSKSNFLLQITNGIWFLEPNAVIDLAPIVSNLLQNNANSFNGKPESAPLFFVGADNSVVFPSKWNSLNDAPVGSTAVINVSGVIMKADNCGDYGTATLIQLLSKANNAQNVNSIVLKIDSPGGSVAGTEDFARAVKNSSKPVVAYVDGMMASAAYWIGSQASEVFVGSETSMIGSIGTMMSFADAQKMWESKGVKFHEVYATASVDKNKDFAEARQGNYEKVKQTLDALNSVFLSSVKEARGTKLNQAETLTGKVFMAKDAIDMGLVDGFKSFEESVMRAQQLAKESSQSSNQSTINQSNQSNMKINAKLGAMVAFLAGAFDGFKAEETAVTEEHLEKMNEELATLEDVRSELETANEEKATALASLATAQTDLATATSALAEANTKIATLEAGSAGASTTLKNGKDNFSTSTDEEYLTSADREKEQLKAQGLL